MKMAIQALEEIQQYREIGTVEECREASEKQKSKKMRLLNEKDVIKAVDKHTNEDNTLNDDISCILEEVPTAYDVEAVSKALKNEMEFVVSEYPVYGKYIEKNRAIEFLHSRSMITSFYAGKISMIQGCKYGYCKLNVDKGRKKR